MGKHFGEVDFQRERLKLIAIAREHPDLFNASLSNFFST
jgi:hypothetical protein